MMSVFEVVDTKEWDMRVVNLKEKVDWENWEGDGNCVHYAKISGGGLKRMFKVLVTLHV